MKNKQTCPHCGVKMESVAMPLDSSWGGEIHTICFNDECSYYKTSWLTLEEQGIEDTGYRCRCDARGNYQPQPVWSSDALRNLIICEETPAGKKCALQLFADGDFVRDDETPDAEFYLTQEDLPSLDSLALVTIEDIYAELIPKGARVLDLMAGTNSHIPDEVEPKSVVGLGLNKKELDANPALTDRVVHDLNANPKLPFQDKEFDVVVNALSVEYMTHPLEIFDEVTRIVKPAGRFIVVFSNRIFPPKTVSIWKRSSEEERQALVRGLFASSENFLLEGMSESKGKPRPADDPLYMMGIPSDPIYAVWGKVRG